MELLYNNTQIILATDNAIGKVFRDKETLIVAQNLSKVTSVFLPPQKNRIWYLGLIAVAKRLFLSHSKDSISLYNEYVSFVAFIRKSKTFE